MAIIDHPGDSQTVELNYLNLNNYGRLAYEFAGVMPQWLKEEPPCTFLQDAITLWFTG